MYLDVYKTFAFVESCYKYKLANQLKERSKAGAIIPPVSSRRFIASVITNAI